jgi:hypothetical protein
MTSQTFFYPNGQVKSKIIDFQTRIIFWGNGKIKQIKIGDFFLEFKANGEISFTNN